MHESVLIAIFDQSREQILLTKRRDVPVWVFPGGRVEKGETPEQAAMREGKEETGCEIELVRKVGNYSPANRLSRHTHFFEARIRAGTPITTDETCAVRFFSTDALPRLIPPPYPIMVEQALHAQEIIETPIPNSSYWTLCKCFFKRPDIIIRFFLMRLGIHFNT